MSDIFESRNVKINGIIVTLENVRRLAIILKKRYEITKEIDVYCKLSFSVICFDDSSFQSSDDSIFANDSVLMSKRVSEVRLKYSSYYENESVEVRLTHGDSKYYNQIEASGTNSEWVNGIVRKLEEEISAFQPQQKIFTKHWKIIHFIFALSLGMTYWYLLSLIPPTATESSVPSWVAKVNNSAVLTYGLKYGFAYLVGMFPAYFMIDKLKKLWPTVELQIGPEHTFVEKKRRGWLGFAITFGVVPVVVSVISDFLKVNW